MAVTWTTTRSFLSPSCSTTGKGISLWRDGSGSARKGVAVDLQLPVTGRVGDDQVEELRARRGEGDQCTAIETSHSPPLPHVPLVQDSGIATTPLRLPSLCAPDLAHFLLYREDLPIGQPIEDVAVQVDLVDHLREQRDGGFDLKAVKTQDSENSRKDSTKAVEGQGKAMDGRERQCRTLDVESLISESSAPT